MSEPATGRPAAAPDRGAASLAGLSEREARERLARVGPNVVAAPRPARWRALAGKFWGRCSGC